MSKKPETPRIPMIGDRVLFVSGDIVRAAVVVRAHDPLKVNVQAFVDGDIAPVWEKNVVFEAEARRLNAQGVGMKINEFWRWPQ